MAINYPHKTVRQIGQPEYRPGQEVIVDLPTGDVIMTTSIGLDFGYVTGVNQRAAQYGAQIALIKSIEFVVADNDRIVNLNAPALYSLYEMDSGRKDAAEIVAFGLVAGDTGRIRVSIPIHHFIPHQSQGNAAALDLRGVDRAFIRIVWANGLEDALYDATGSSVSKVKCTITCDMLNRVPATQPRALIRELTYRRIPVPSDDPQMRIKIERKTGMWLQRAHLICTRFGEYTRDVASYGGTLSPIFKSDVSVYAGSQQFGRAHWSHFRETYEQLRSLRLPTGIVPFSVSNYGNPAEMIDLNALDDNLTIEGEVIGDIGTDEAVMHLVTSSLRNLKVS